MRLSFSTVMVSPLMTATGRLESSATAAAADCGAGAVCAAASCCAKAAEASSSSGMSVRLIKSNPPDGVSDDALTNRFTRGEHSGGGLGERWHYHGREPPRDSEEEVVDCQR